jgi:hypothetical protein
VCLLPSIQSGWYINQVGEINIFSLSGMMAEMKVGSIPQDASGTQNGRIRCVCQSRAVSVQHGPKMETFVCLG